MLVRTVNDIDELFPALYHIGNTKNVLPFRLRGWVNILGLYVQKHLEFPGRGCREWLEAGGEYISYFYAICEYTMNGDKDNKIMASTMTGDFSYWEVRKFDQKEWEKRFAHLVEPTCEIAFYLLEENEPSGSKLKGVADHFESTGEWLGLCNQKCASCGHIVVWWDYFHCKPCPFCGGKIRD